MLTPQEIQEKKFEKAMFGGYEMGQVDVFLDSVLADYTALYKENATLKTKMKILVDKIEEYRAVDEEMRKTLYTAQKNASEITDSAQKTADELSQSAAKTAEELTEKAKEESETLLAESKEKAEKMLAESKEKAETLVAKSKEKADKLLADSKEKSDKLIAESEEKSEKLLTESQEKADKLLTESKEQAEKLLAESEEKANKLLTESQEKADTLVNETQGKVEANLIELQRESVDEKAKLDEIKDLNAEYVSKIKFLMLKNVEMLEGIVERPLPPVEEADITVHTKGEAAAETPVAAEPAPAAEAEPATPEPAAEEPAAEIAAESVIEEAVTEEPVMEDAVTEEPVMEDSVVEEPAEEPVIEEAAAEEPAIIEDIAAEQVEVIEEPATEQAAVIEETGFFTEEAPADPFAAEPFITEAVADIEPVDNIIAELSENSPELEDAITIAESIDGIDFSAPAQTHDFAEMPRMDDIDLDEINAIISDPAIFAEPGYENRFPDTQAIDGIADAINTAADLESAASAETGYADAGNDYAPAETFAKPEPEPIPEPIPEPEPVVEEVLDPMEQRKKRLLAIEEARRNASAAKNASQETEEELPDALFQAVGAVSAPAGTVSDFDDNVAPYDSNASFDSAASYDNSYDSTYNNSYDNTYSADISADMGADMSAGMLTDMPADIPADMDVNITWGNAPDPNYTMEMTPFTNDEYTSNETYTVESTDGYTDFTFEADAQGGQFYTEGGDMTTYEAAPAEMSYSPDFDDTLVFTGSNGMREDEAEAGGLSSALPMGSNIREIDPAAVGINSDIETRFFEVNLNSNRMPATENDPNSPLPKSDLLFGRDYDVNSED